MITIARPTPVSIDKNHHTPDRRTSGMNKGVKATRAHPRPMMVMTSLTAGADHRGGAALHSTSLPCPDSEGVSKAVGSGAKHPRGDRARSDRCRQEL